MSMSSFGAGNVANKSNKLIIGIIIVAMLLVIAGTLVFFSRVIQTETYWVLNQPVPQKSQITETMLTEVETSKDGAPKTVQEGGIALTPVEVSTGSVFTRIPLQPGDLVTTSNTTSGFSDIRVGIPDEWTITSLSVPADNASGGRITRGTYFDIMVVNAETDDVFFPFVNLLCLETSVSLNAASSSDAVNTGEAKAGQTELYYVGLPINKIAELRSLLNNDNYEIFLNLAPIQNDYNGAALELYQPEGGDNAFRFNAAEYELTDSGLGTDSNFTLTKRDENGIPTEVFPNGAPRDPEAPRVFGTSKLSESTWSNWFSQYSLYLESRGGSHELDNPKTANSAGGGNEPPESTTPGEETE